MRASVQMAGKEEVGRTHRNQAFHGIQLFPVAVGIQLLPDVPNLVLWCVEVRRASTASYGEVSSALGDSLLQTRPESSGIFGDGVQIQARHVQPNVGVFAHRMEFAKAPADTFDLIYSTRQASRKKQDCILRYTQKYISFSSILYSGPPVRSEFNVSER